MNSSGQMVTGRQDINGLRYYFNQGGAMAETDISNVISNALKPVGKTLYVWGGGWNEADNGSGETSLYIGVWPQWEQYFETTKIIIPTNQGRLHGKGKQKITVFWDWIVRAI